MSLNSIPVLFDDKSLLFRQIVVYSDGKVVTVVEYKKMQSSFHMFSATISISSQMIQC